MRERERWRGCKEELEKRERWGKTKKESIRERDIECIKRETEGEKEKDRERDRERGRERERETESERDIRKRRLLVTTYGIAND